MITYITSLPTMLFSPSSSVVNMALRANSSNETDENSNSPVPGFHYFRLEADKTTSYEWEQWVQLFEVAVLARHSISVSELVREEDQNNPRSAALMGIWSSNQQKEK